MSVGPSGPVDQPDYQLVTNWDPGAPTFSYTGAVAPPVQTPAIPCSQYSGIFFFLQAEPCLMQVELTWYGDAGLTEQMGSLSICSDGSNAGQFQAIIPNLGPYLQVTYSALPGSGGTEVTTYVILTNRTAPALLLSNSGLLMNKAPALAAGAAATLYPNGYANALVQWLIFGGAEGVTVQWQTLTPAGSYVTFYQETVGVNAVLLITLRFPPGSFRVIVTNTSPTVANNTSTIVATQTLGGA